MATEEMPKTVSLHGIQATCTASWVDAFGNAGDDYRWTQGNKSGTFALTTYQRGDNKPYFCWRVSVPKKTQQPPAALLEHLKAIAVEAAEKAGWLFIPGCGLSREETQRSWDKVWAMNHP